MDGDFEDTGNCDRPCFFLAAPHPKAVLTDECPMPLRSGDSCIWECTYPYIGVGGIWCRDGASYSKGTCGGPCESIPDPLLAGLVQLRRYPSFFAGDITADLLSTPEWEHFVDEVDLHDLLTPLSYVVEGEFLPMRHAEYVFSVSAAGTVHFYFDGQLQLKHEDDGENLVGEMTTLETPPLLLSDKRSFPYVVYFGKSEGSARLRLTWKGTLAQQRFTTDLSVPFSPYKDVRVGVIDFAKCTTPVADKQTCSWSCRYPYQGSGTATCHNGAWASIGDCEKPCLSLPNLPAGAAYERLCDVPVPSGGNCSYICEGYLNRADCVDGFWTEASCGPFKVVQVIHSAIRRCPREAR